MKEFFEPRKLTGSISLNLQERGKWVADKAAICKAIIEIVEDYMQQDYKLTLRQLYYQLVSKDIIWNHDTVYKKISALLDDLRYAGELDWDAIEDRGRVPFLPYYCIDVDDAINDTIRDYRLNRQEGQSNVIEVWTEKDAISSILKRVTSKYHVRLVVNKGYSSSTAMYAAYKRIVSHINEGRRVKVLYFGDHDPSGLDMVRDIDERIKFFMKNGGQIDDSNAGDLTEGESDLHRMVIERYKCNGGEITASTSKNAKKLIIVDRFSVEHVGLTAEQIALYNPPPNPAKITDPRAKWYIENHGEVSYEVDALEPRIMEKILIDAIESNIDMSAYLSQIKKEAADIEKLKSVLDK